MINISADRPVVDPEDDLFGHAHFAELLATSIHRYTDSNGLVMALFGPWGSGKSSALNFIQHYLKQEKENKPIIITFNPWWFSGQDNLARAFLGQLQAVLPGKSEKFKKLGDLFCDLAEEVGGLAELTGKTFGAGTLLGKVAKHFKRKPKDVPALKKEIGKILLEAEQKILVIVDDIDRLTPDETRQLFTVIKALADFPNVLYLLALDREVATQAMAQIGMPGDRYLEKIIQVPFTLPPANPASLQNNFQKQIFKIFQTELQDSLDQNYWEQVFWGGIQRLIQTPRDAIRFINTLSVTYLSVKGEVNPTDFIAIEALRVFVPRLYEMIRLNPHRCTGGANEDLPESHGQFYLELQKKIPYEYLEGCQRIIGIVFPRLRGGAVLADGLREARKSLRAYHPELFLRYFCLAVSPADEGFSEMLALLKKAKSIDDLKRFLRAMNKVQHQAYGSTKVSALLYQLIHHVNDVPYEHISNIVHALLDVGDELEGLNPCLIVDILRYETMQKAQQGCVSLLKEAITHGHALKTSKWLIDHLVRNPQDISISPSEIEPLKLVWKQRVKKLMGVEAEFTQAPDIHRG
jgi:predicted KAP-like P-loop ATPase